MIPPCSRSSLFPYTTLFRSAPHRFVQLVSADDLPFTPSQRREQVELAHRQCQRAAARSREVLGRPNLELDRKSTRLNSSHMSISYAVFCLKKKNYLP